MDPSNVVAHYTQGDVLGAIKGGLEKLGRTPDNCELADIDPAVQFHVGGAMTARRLFEATGLQAGQAVLDVGCGLGGPAMLAAIENGVKVTGIDLTPQYIDGGSELIRWLKLEDSVKLMVGDATTMSGVSDASMDAAYMLHVGMNITDKAALAKAIARVLKPGGKFGVFDMMACPGGEDLIYPLPPAGTAAIAAFGTPDDYKQACSVAGLELVSEDMSFDCAAAIEGMMAKVKAYVEANGSPPPLGLFVVMGSDFKEKMANTLQCFKTGRMQGGQMVWQKPG